MENSLVNGQTKIQNWKQLWSMPGGTFAKITAVGAAFGLGYGFFKALPLLIAGAANMLIFMAELVGIAAILMIVTSKSFWKWISLFWLQVNRKIVSMFVKIDPISILENGIYELKQKLATVNENITKLGGILEGMKKSLAQYEGDFENNINRRNTLKDKLADPNIPADKVMEYKSAYIVTCNDITRLDKIIASQKKRIETSEKYLQVMKKLQVVAKFKVKDSESDLKYRKADYEAAKAQTTALKSISSIVSGGLTKSLEEELALGYIADTVNQSVAEMQALLDGSNDLLVNFDIDSAANIEKADKIIERIEKNGFESFSQEVPYQSGSVDALPNKVNDDSIIRSAHAETSKIPTRNNYFG